MENDSDMLNILSSDENQANFEILNSDLEENAIPLEIMSGGSEESTCSQADDKDTTSRNADANGLNTLSSSSSCCRICQNGDSSEQLLENSPCHCKGYLGKAHRKCLVEWVRYKGSNSCEICGALFSGIPPPHHLGVNQIEPEVDPPDFNNYFEALEALRWQMDRYRPVSRDRRSAMAGLIVFLVLVTFVSAILTVGADRDFRRITHDPWATRSDQEKTHIVFSICISFLFFSGTLTIGLAMLWLVLECYYATHRRRVIQRTAERMIAESMRERRRAAENARATIDTVNARDRNHVATSARNVSETTQAVQDEVVHVEIPAGSTHEVVTAEASRSQRELNENHGTSHELSEEI